MRRWGPERRHAHGPRQRDICWVNGGSLPPAQCKKCRESDPDDQLERLSKRLENTKTK